MRADCIRVSGQFSQHGILQPEPVFRGFGPPVTYVRMSSIDTQ